MWYDQSFSPLCLSPPSLFPTPLSLPLSPPSSILSEVSYKLGGSGSTSPPPSTTPPSVGYLRSKASNLYVTLNAANNLVATASSASTATSFNIGLSLSFYLYLPLFLFSVLLIYILSSLSLFLFLLFSFSTQWWRILTAERCLLSIRDCRCRRYSFSSLSPHPLF